jgi:transcriptional regulator with XRE-family HTH domain
LKTKHQEEVRLDLKAIGRRVREIRGFDLKQTDFAKILGIGQTQLSKYERGKSAPTAEILLKLKRFSGKSIDWILTGEMTLTSTGAHAKIRGSD